MSKYEIHIHSGQNLSIGDGSFTGNDQPSRSSSLLPFTLLTVVLVIVGFLALQQRWPIDVPWPFNPKTTMETSMDTTIETTSTPIPQRVFLRRSCGELTHVVEANRPIQLLYGVWVAKGKGFLEDDLKHLSVKLRVDGKIMQGELQSPTPISRIPCGKVFEEGYWAAYMIQLPPLSPGEHIIEFVYSFDGQVTDGYDSDGDGELDLFGPGEWGEQSYTLIVEPLNTRPR